MSVISVFREGSTKNSDASSGTDYSTFPYVRVCVREYSSALIRLARSISASTRFHLMLEDEREQKREKILGGITRSPFRSY